MNKAPIKMTPGDDTHLTLLMAPVSLNFVTGIDREHLLAYGRAAFEAGQKCQGCAVQQGTHVPAEAVVQIQEPATQSAEILISAVMLKVSTLVDKRASGEPCAEAEADLLQFLRTKLAAVQQAVPAFYAVIGESGNALPQYAASTEEGVIHNVLAVARNEGYKGDGISRLIELGWKVRPVYTHPTQQGLDRQQIDPLRQMLAQHEAHLEQNPHAYFELAYTRSTSWMVWITDKPLCSPVVNPDRKVLWSGQGETPDEACENAALAAQAKQGE